MAVKRYLVGAAVGVGAFLCWPIVRCWWKGHKNLDRSPHGTFHCADCGTPFADYGEAGTMDDGYVRNTRNYSQANGGTLIRSERWDSELH